MTSLRSNHKSGIDPADYICHFCRKDAPNTPYRVEMNGEDGPAGGRWSICNPGCTSKPPGRRIVMESNWKGKRK